MSRSLLIAVQFHEGRYHGQEDRFNGADGWPPSPGRLFQALVAGVAQGARLAAEDEQALKWLERLAPPKIAAPSARRGRVVKLFVPNNDLDSVGGNPARVGEIRVGKPWRPCFFDPDETVLYVWDFDSGSPEAVRICAIAARLYQLGRGIDMAWAIGQVLGQDEAAALLQSHPGPLRTPRGAGETVTPHSGTLDSLVDRYRHKRRRLSPVDPGLKFSQLFTQPPKASFRHAGYDTSPRCLHFELRGPENDFAPRPLASTAPLITGFRDAAARRLQDAQPAKSALFERLIIGRGAGPRDLVQRIRLMPIPSIGARHTDPSIRRIMVEIPADCPIRADDLKWAFAGLEPYNPQTGEVWPGRLVSTEDSRMADRFMRRGHTFRSMTPVALSSAQRRRVGITGEKLAEERSQEERRAAGAVVQGLRHAGIQTRLTDVRVQREPFQKMGVRAEFFSSGSRFSKHVLWHVELRCRDAIGRIGGPLVIGDGRFCGLGLMEPVVDHGNIFVFNLDAKRRIAPEDGRAVVSYLRRALMSLARDNAGRVGRLFSGHESNGRSDSAGYHAHVFLAADGGSQNDDSITRLVVAAPWAVDRTAKARPDDRRLFDEVTRQLSELRAGELGRFRNLWAEFIANGDPLLGPAKTWLSKTLYIATRNLRKRDDPAATVKADVAAECHRRGLPAPKEIQVSRVNAGPRGGRPTAELKLCFATAIRGPLLLGRDSHAGGGLFHAVSSGG